MSCWNLIFFSSLSERWLLCVLSEPNLVIFKVLSLSATKKVPKEKAPLDVPAEAGALHALSRSGSTDGPSMARLPRGRLLPCLRCSAVSKGEGYAGRPKRQTPSVDSSTIELTGNF